MRLLFSFRRAAQGSNGTMHFNSTQQITIFWLFLRTHIDIDWAKFSERKFSAHALRIYNTYVKEPWLNEDEC